MWSIFSSLAPAIYDMESHIGPGGDTIMAPRLLDKKEVIAVVNSHYYNSDRGSPSQAADRLSAVQQKQNKGTSPIPDQTQFIDIAQYDWFSFAPWRKLVVSDRHSRGHRVSSRSLVERSMSELNQLAKSETSAAESLVKLWQNDKPSLDIELYGGELMRYFKHTHIVWKDVKSHGLKPIIESVIKGLILERMYIVHCRPKAFRASGGMRYIRSLLDEVFVEYISSLPPALSVRTANPPFDRFLWPDGLDYQRYYPVIWDIVQTNIANKTAYEQSLIEDQILVPTLEMGEDGDEDTAGNDLALRPYLPSTSIDEEVQDQSKGKETAKGKGKERATSPSGDGNENWDGPQASWVDRPCKNFDVTLRTQARQAELMKGVTSLLQQIANMDASNAWDYKKHRPGPRTLSTDVFEPMRALQRVSRLFIILHNNNNQPRSLTTGVASECCP